MVLSDALVDEIYRVFMKLPMEAIEPTVMKLRQEVAVWQQQTAKARGDVAVTRVGPSIAQSEQVDEHAPDYGDPIERAGGPEPFDFRKQLGEKKGR
jgi:hypothetical protein